MNTMIETWDEAKALAKQANEDPNFYLEVQEKGMDSLQSKIETFHATTQDFWYNLLNPTLLGAGIDLITGLADAIAGLTKSMSKIPGLGSIASLAPILSLVFGGATLGHDILKERGRIKKEEGSAGIFGGFKEGFTEWKHKITKVGLTKDATEYGNYVDIFKMGYRDGEEFFDSFTKGVNGKSKKTKGGIFGKLFHTSKKTNNAGNKLFGKLSDVKGLNKITGGIKGIVSGLNSVWSSMTGITRTVVGLGAISIGIGLFDKFVDSSKDVKEHVESIKNSLKSNNEELKNSSELVKTQGNRWTDLKEGVNATTGENISLSNDEFKEYHEITNQIADSFPNLVAGFDSEGNAILDTATNVSVLNEELEKLSYFNSIEFLKNTDDIFKNFNNVTGKRDIWTAIKDGALDWFGTIINNPVERGKGLSNSNAYELLKDLSEIKYTDGMTYQDFVTKAYKYNTVQGGNGEADSYIKGLLGINQISFMGKNEKEEISEKEYTKIMDKVRSEKKQIDIERENAAKDLRLVYTESLNSILKNPENKSLFDDLGKEAIANINSFLNGMSLDTLVEFNDRGITPVEFVDKLTKDLSNADDGRLQQQFNKVMSVNADSSFEEIKEAFSEFGELKNTLFKDISEKDLIKQFGFEDVELMNSAYERITSKISNSITKDSEETKYSNNLINQLIDEKQKLESAYNAMNEHSNIDYSKRPMLTGQDMLDHGWKGVGKDSTVTTFSNGFYGSDFKDTKSKNKNLYLEVTPILDNGEILSPSALESYVEQLFQSDDVLESDKLENGGKGIIQNLFNSPTSKELNEYQDKLGIIKNAHAELTYNLEELQKAINDKDTKSILSILDEIDDELLDDSTLKKQVKEAKKFYTLQSKVTKEYKKQGGNLKDVDKFIEDNQINTDKEFKLLEDCVNETNNWAEAMDAYRLQSIDIKVNDQELSSLESNLQEVEQNIKKIHEASDASATPNGMNKEQISNISSIFGGLEGYDYNKLFEYTAEGVSLNANELERLNKLYADTNRAKYTDEVEDLQHKYQELCFAIEDTNLAESKERTTLINKRDAIADQIEKSKELLSCYEGLTNAVAKWQQAQSGKERGDTYDSIFKGIEETEKLYTDGLVGTNKFKTFVQMMSNEDLTGQGSGTYVDVYEKQMPKMKKYFTEGQEGARSFLTDLSNIDESWAKLNNDGSWTINANIKNMAKELNFSESLISEIFKKLNDYGFAIDFVEESDNLKTLRVEAEKVSDSLQKAFGKKYSVDLTVTDKDAISTQIKNLEKLQKQCQEGSKEYEDLNTQIKYLKTKAGELETALNFNINYRENKDEIDEIIGRLKKLKNYENLEFNFTTKNVTNVNNQIKAVKDKLDNLKDDKGVIDLKQEGASDLVDIFNALNNLKNELERPAIVNLDKNDFDGKYQDILVKLQDYRNKVEDFNSIKANASVGIVTEVKVDEAKAELESALNKIVNNPDKEEASILASLQINQGATQDQIDAALSNLDVEKMIHAGFDLTEDAKAKMGDATSDKNIKFTGDTSDPEIKLNNVIERARNANPTIHFLQTGLDGIESRVNSLASSNASVPAFPTSPGNIRPFVNGTAHAAGTVKGNIFKRGLAYVRGKWGAKESGTSLVGELGPELRVRDGEWELLGANSAEFTNVKKDDIIFNHKQTEELLKNGYVTSSSGRGKAYAGGSLNGNYVSNNSFYGSNKFYGGTSANNNNNNNRDNNEKEKDPEIFDWIEIKIDRLERKIEELSRVAESAYKKFSRRNSALAQEFSKITEEINVQQKAYDVYMKKAESISLSGSYKSKVRNGSLSIQEITDENLSKAIKQYQEFYNKALDAKKAVEELKEKLGELAEQKFDNVKNMYDGLLEGIEHDISMLDGQLDIIEAQGNFAGKAYFDALAKSEKQNIDKLQAEYKELQDARNEALVDGSIERESEADVNLRNQINDVAKAWQDATLQLKEYKNEMREADWGAFEWAQEAISDITAESEFVRGLLEVGENDLFNKDTGKLNDKGMSSGALHAMDYDVYMQQADEYAKKVKEIDKELASDPTNTILLDKKREYIQAQRDSISAANDEKKAIKDLISESYDKMLNVLQELIDKRKEALDKEKSLYDYQKKIAEQTKSITDIQKQLMAIEGDDSEEAKAKRQGLTDDLQKAKDELEESEYDRYMDDQTQLLDKLYENYEKVLNERLDNIDGLLQSMIDYGNSNAETVNGVITESTEKVGYDITQGIGNIWNSTDSGPNKILTMYGNNFSSIMTSTNHYVSSILQLMHDATKSKATVSKPKDTSKKASSSKPASKPASKPKSSGSSSSKKKPVTVGGMVNAGNALIYSNAYGGGGAHQYFADDPIYKVLEKQNGYVLVRWHGRSTGYTGWFKERDLVGLRTGGYTGNNEGVAMLHKKERVLTNRQTLAFDNLVYTLLPEFAKTLQTSNVKNIGSHSNIQIGDIHFELPNVVDANSFMKELQSNKKFSRLITSIVLDPLTGKGTLSKNKIRL